MFTKLLTRGSLCAGAVLLAACSDPVTPAVEFEHCRQDAGVEICIENESYEAGSSVPMVIVNRTGEQLYLHCSAGVEGRRSLADPWSRSFGAGRSCESNGPESWTSLPPGAVVPDRMLTNEEAHDGEWRAYVWVLDETGEPLRDEPFVSPVFRLN